MRRLTERTAVMWLDGQAMRKKVAEDGRVMSSETMDRMIDSAVEKAMKRCSDTGDDDDDNITQEFVEKVIERIFDDINADEQT